MTNALIMPSTFVEVKDKEVEYIDGSWNWWNFAKVAAITVAITAAFVFICATGAVAIPGILAGCGIKYSLTVGALYGLDALGASIASMGLNALINGVIAGLGL